MYDDCIGTALEIYMFVKCGGISVGGKVYRIVLVRELLQLPDCTKSTTAYIYWSI